MCREYRVDNVSIAYNAYKTRKRAGRRGNAVIPALTPNRRGYGQSKHERPALRLLRRDARCRRGAEDALSHVRAQEDAHRITTVQAAAERVGLLERHLADASGYAASCLAVRDEFGCCRTV